PVLMTTSGDFRNLHDWSADGARVMFSQDLDGAAGLFMVDVGDAGPGEPVQLDAALPLVDHIDFRTRFSSDGARVFYRSEKDADTTALVTLEVDSGGPLGAPVELSE